MIFCVAVILLAGFAFMTGAGRSSLPLLTYSQFLEQVSTERVASIVVLGTRDGTSPATCQMKNGATLRTVLPFDYSDALSLMEKHGINIEIRESESALTRTAVNSIPFLLLLAFWVFMMIRGLPKGWRHHGSSV